MILQWLWKNAMESSKFAVLDTPVANLFPGRLGDDGDEERAREAAEDVIP